MAVTDADVTRAAPRVAVATAGQRRRIRPARVLLHAFLIGTCLIWLPACWWGVVSPPPPLAFSNSTPAWTTPDLPRYYLNPLIVAVPAVLLTLLLASFIGFPV